MTREDPAGKFPSPQSLRFLKGLHDGAGSPGANQNLSKTHLISRNVTLRGRRTSIRLEPEMWIALLEICRREGMSIHTAVERIMIRLAAQQSLTSAVRVFIMAYYKAASTEEGHAKAGHPSHWVGG